MKKPILAVLAGLSAILLTSCAPVKFYSDSALTKKSGLKYYTAKPYLQVEKEISTGNVVKSTVIYLPDLSEPVYLVIKDGVGSRKVDVKITDGTITTLGVASDPKVSETVESLAALISKTTSAVTDLVSLKGLPPASVASNVTELYEVLITQDGTSLRKVEIK
jgi:hypothetical protein